MKEYNGCNSFILVLDKYEYPLDEREKFQKLENNIKTLKIKLKNCQKLLSKKNKNNKNFKTIIKKRQYQYKSKTNNFLKQNIIANSEFRLKQFKKKGRRYSESDKSFALGLFYHSPAAYRFMRSYLCLPTIRSLRRWLQALNVSCGINDNVLNILKLKFQSASPKERLISIILDEMSIKKMISYNSQNDTFMGFEDFGKDFNLNTLKFGTQVLVLMVKSLTLPWKQVIGFYVSNSSVSGNYLKNILINAIDKLTNCGLIPKVIISDQGSNNLKMRRLFGITNENPFITYNNNNIYLMHDSPHLIKSVRNNFKKYTFTSENETYSWKDIVDFYNIDSVNSPRLASKLKKIHICLPPFSPMRVCLATQVLSHSVSAGILTLVAFNKLPSKAVHTAKCIQFFNDLFDCFNSIKKNESVALRKPMKKDSIHWDFLEKAQTFLSNLKVNNKRNRLPHCIIGWQENIVSIKLLFNELNTNYGVEYLLTRRLTQDCIECLFSVLRAKGGNNSTPDASKIFSAIRMAMCNMLINPSNNANCEKDASQFLNLTKDYKQITINLNTNQSLIDQKHTDDYTKFLSLMNINYILMNDETISGVAYITGWVCSQLEHEPCLEQLATTNQTNNVFSSHDNTHIKMKEYDDCKLLYPYEVTLEFTKHVTALFNSSIDQLLLEKKENVRKTIKEIINLTCKRYILKLNICEECYTKFIDKLLNVNINSFVKKCNDSFHKYKYSKNQKLKKITNF